MKTLIKAVLVITLLAGGAAGWLAWRNNHASSRSGGDPTIVKAAERLADRLRGSQQTVATNKVLTSINKSK